MVEKRKVQMTPELVRALAQYAGTQLPEERVEDIAASLQGLADALDSVEDARLRDVEPAFIQPLRPERGGR